MLTQTRALSGVRLALVFGVLALVLLQPDAIAASIDGVLLATTIYAVVVAALTLLQYRRVSSAPVTLLLLVDATALVTLITVTGGPGSPVMFVALLQIVAASLLVSPGTAVRLGAWYALLLLAAQQALDRGIVSMPVDPLNWSLPAAALVFIAFAIACSLVAAAEGRAQSHTHDYFHDFADLSTELESQASAIGVTVVLARHLLDRLQYRRVAVIDLTGPTGVLAASNLGPPADGDGGGSNTRYAFDRSAEPDEAFTACARRLADGRAEIRVVDEELRPLVDRFLPEARHVLVLPLTDHDEHYGLVLAEWDGSRVPRIPRDLFDAAVQAGAHSALVLRNCQLRLEIEQLATKDPLTGLPNRRVLSGAMERELARARRYGRPLGLVMLDLDHFKRINDQFGHAVGDVVLRDVAHGLREAARGEDLVARYGGEEFVVLLPGVDADTLGDAADRIRRLAAAASVTTPVTLSAGVACFPYDAGDEAALFEAADLALYRAKRAGRDRTQISALTRRRRTDIRSIR